MLAIEETIESNFPFEGKNQETRESTQDAHWYVALRGWADVETQGSSLLSPVFPPAHTSAPALNEYHANDPEPGLQSLDLRSAFALHQMCDVRSIQTALKDQFANL